MYGWERVTIGCIGGMVAGLLAVAFGLALSNTPTGPDYSAATATVHNSHWTLRSPGMAAKGDTVSGAGAFGRCSVQFTAAISNPGDVTATFPSGVTMKVRDITPDQAREQTGRLGLTDC